jgi:PAT family beta-lactamase induction signal transducer AmpG
MTDTFYSISLSLTPMDWRSHPQYFDLKRISIMFPKKPFTWISTLYFMQGFPFAIVMIVSTIFYKMLGIENSKIAFYTSLLTLPWFLKPLVAPLLEIIASKKIIILTTEFLMSALLFCLALSLFEKNISFIFITSWFILAFLAISSAIHDIVTDGFYILNLSLPEQKKYVGLRSSCYHLARFTSSGLAIMLIGFATTYFSTLFSWQITFLFFGIIFFLIAIYHRFVLPETENIIFNLSVLKRSTSMIAMTFKQFRTLPYFSSMLFFLIIYNSAEAQLIKIVPLFLFDPKTQGGLGLTTADVGLIYGSLGVVSLMLGVICGSLLSNRWEIRFFLSIGALLALLTNMSYLILVFSQNLHLIVIALIIMATQFAFGISNSAYMAYLLNLIQDQEYRMSIYAAAASTMSLGITLFASISGYVLLLLTYHYFFIWISFLGVFIFIYSAYFLKMDEE